MQDQKKKEENWTNRKSDGREDEKVPDVRQEWVTHILDTISLLPHNFSLIVSMVRCWQVFSRRWRELTSFSSEYVYIDVYGWLNVVMHLKHWLTWISSLAEFINHINCYFGRTIRNYEWGRRQQLANLRNWNHYHKNVHSLLPRPIRLTQKKITGCLCEMFFFLAWCDDAHQLKWLCILAYSTDNNASPNRKYFPIY